MNRFCLKSSRLCHALGCPPSGRCQKNVHALLLKITDNHVDGGRLARTGSARQDKDTILHCLRHRSALQCIELHLACVLHLPYFVLKTRKLCFRKALCPVKRLLELIEHSGTVELGIVIAHAIDALHRLHFLDDEFFVDRKVCKLRLNLLRRQAKQRGSPL